MFVLFTTVNYKFKQLRKNRASCNQSHTFTQEGFLQRALHSLLFLHRPFFWRILKWMITTRTIFGLSVNAFSTPKIEIYDKNCKRVPQKKPNLKQLKGKKFMKKNIHYLVKPWIGLENLFLWKCWWGAHNGLRANTYWARTMSRDMCFFLWSSSDHHGKWSSYWSVIFPIYG